MSKFRMWLNIIAVVITGFLYYFILPPLNVRAREFYFFIGIILIIFGTVNFIAGFAKKNGAKFSVFKVSTKVLLVLAAVFILGSLSSLIFFRAKSYSNLISMQEGKFAEDVEEVDFDQIPSVDRDTAIKLGSRKMGQMGDLVSQYNINDTYSQINLKGKPVRVSSLEYASFFKWLTNRGEGIPYYISVDMVTQEANLNKLSKPMRYSQSDKFSRNIYRKLRFSKPTYIFYEVNLELDDQGNPYWVAPAVEPKVGLFGGYDTNKVVTVNAVNGEVKDYGVDNIPEWIDRAYPADLILKQLEYNGRYKKGFMNSFIKQEGVTEPTKGYNYLSLGEDIYLYTGITSVIADESNIGFVLVNMRTKETKFYPVSSAEEFSVMESAAGTVQEKNYESTFPILINMGNRPTYFMSLKDKAGLTKMYALVDAENYQRVAVGDTIAEAVESYGKFSGLSKADENQKNVSKEIEVEDVKEVVIDGNTTYIIKAVNDDKYYIASISVSEKLAFIKAGDRLSIKGTEDDKQFIILVLE